MINNIIDYTREHPYEAIAVISALYVVMIVFILPITHINILVAYAYCKVYQSYWKGLLMSSFVVWLGNMLGAIAAFLLGRFLIAEWLRRKIKKSNDPRMQKFRAVDTLFVTNGILAVGLLRMIFLPFGVMCYLLAVTSVSFLDYVIGTTFIIVKVVLLCLIGCSIWEAEETSKEDG